MTPTAKRTILLVEDNPDDVALTVRAFRQSMVRCDLVIAQDGLAALDYMLGAGPYAGRDLSQMPRVILLDLKLPSVNGLETLQRLRLDERTRFVPVIVLTSSREEQDIVASYSLGANSYIRKPVEFSEFIEMVKHIGYYWLDLNEPPPRGGN
ncbi:MAG: two-component system response regulator [Chloroflexi bacterium]|nr:MAG: two-component system response regulator [Chloroflexota bacterium]